MSDAVTLCAYGQLSLSPVDIFAIYVVAYRAQFGSSAPNDVKCVYRKGKYWPTSLGWGCG